MATAHLGVSKERPDLSRTVHRYALAAAKDVGRLHSLGKPLERPEQLAQATPYRPGSAPLPSPSATVTRTYRPTKYSREVVVAVIHPVKTASFPSWE